MRDLEPTESASFEELAPGISNNADQVKQLLRDRALAALDRPQSQLPAILCFDIVGGGSRIWRSQRRRNSWATSPDTSSDQRSAV